MIGCLLVSFSPLAHFSQAPVRRFQDGLDERSTARKGTSNTPHAVHDQNARLPICGTTARLPRPPRTQVGRLQCRRDAHDSPERLKATQVPLLDRTMASQMTAKELAKMVQLCGRAEDQGIIDDEDVKQLIKAMDDAALPTLVREENWRKAHERRKKRNNKPETPPEDRYVPFYEKEARLDNAVRMLQDKLTANTPKGEALKLFRRAAHGNDTLPVAELIPAMRETLRISEADLSPKDLENMLRGPTDRFADDQGNLDLEWMSSEAERLMKTWEVERQTEKRLTRETPMQRSRRIKREQTQMSAAEL